MIGDPIISIEIEYISEFHSFYNKIGFTSGTVTRQGGS